MLLHRVRKSDSGKKVSITSVDWPSAANIAFNPILSGIIFLMVGLHPKKYTYMHNAIPYSPDRQQTFRLLCREYMTKSMHSGTGPQI